MTSAADLVTAPVTVLSRRSVGTRPWSEVAQTVEGAFSDMMEMMSLQSGLMGNVRNASLSIVFRVVSSPRVLFGSH